MVRGASRTTLGECLSIHCSDSGEVRLSSSSTDASRVYRGATKLVPTVHEEADTSVVYSATQHALLGRTVLLRCQDYDNVMAAQAGCARLRIRW